MDINEVIDLYKKYHKMYWATGLISLNSSRGIQLDYQEFIKHFDTGYELKEREDDEMYPYELEKQKNGVLFFALLNKTQYKEEVWLS